MRQQLLLSGGHMLALLLFAGLILAGSAHIGGREAATTDSFVLETPETSEMEATDTVQPLPDGSFALEGDDGSAGGNGDIPVTAKPLRQVAPETSDLGSDAATLPLERVAPREALSAERDKMTEAAAKPVLLSHPVAVSAGLLSFGDGPAKTGMIQLDGIAPQSTERRCNEGGDGNGWPCGMVARTALRNFLRGRALSCIVPADGWETTITTACTVGGRDPAEWLVANGWAEAAPGSGLEGEENAARRARLGLFGPDPRSISVVPGPLPSLDVDEGDL